MKMLIKNAKTVKNIKKEIEAIKSSEISKSAKIKEMFGLGLGIKEIASIMEIRYQFAYNVITNYINMNGIEVLIEERESKKEIIITQYLAGKTNKEISIDLKVNYNYVFKILKEYKLANQAVTEAK